MTTCKRSAQALPPKLLVDSFYALIRIGELADNRLVARKLCDHRRILCAAPAYLQRHGEPKAPVELATHNCLGFTGLHSFPVWGLARGDDQKAVRVQVLQSWP